MKVEHKRKKKIKQNHEYVKTRFVIPQFQYFIREWIIKIYCPGKLQPILMQFSVVVVFQMHKHITKKLGKFIESGYNLVTRDLKNMINENYNEQREE